LADLAIGASKRFLDGQIQVEPEQGAVRLTGPETEDDYPATARSKDSTTWLDYVAYQPGRVILMERVKAGNFEELEPKDKGDQFLLRRFDGKVWHPPLDVTGEGLRVWRPAVAVKLRRPAGLLTRSVEPPRPRRCRRSEWGDPWPEGGRLAPPPTHRNAGRESPCGRWSGG
jgi:hypothetical protein